jgi:hypothetical protein
MVVQWDIGSAGVVGKTHAYPPSTGRLGRVIPPERDEDVFVRERLT